MKKGPKIKRYNKLYRHDYRKQVLKVVGSVVGLASFFLAGWFLYEPVYNFLIQMENPFVFKMPAAEESSSVPESQAAESAPAPTPSTPAVPSESPERLCFFPSHIMVDPELLERSLDALEGSGVDGILFDLKDSTGYLQYWSNLPLVEEVRAQAAASFHLPSVVEAITSRGLAPVGRVYAFKDHVAAYEMYDAGVKYDNSVVIWIDNAREAGGKPWLNPYSEDAVAYILMIAEEVADLGMRDIVFDGLQFPQGVSLDMATYPGETEEVSYSQVLQDFQTLARARMEAKDVRMWTAVSTAALLGQMPNQYGDEPELLLNGRVMLNVMPVQYGSSLRVGGETVFSPLDTPYDAVRVALEGIGGEKLAAPEMEIVGLVQAYTAPGGDSYTRSQVNEQIRALREAGIQRILLYNPSGTYRSYY